jgi:pSer/pThr/pTyr-binding forkhead associated (FHA) protein
MVELRVLTGKQAGAVVVARRFPWRIGRAPDTDLRLEESGVWDHHLELSFKVPDGVGLSRQPDAFATVNGQVFQQTLLRNGDLIELGPVKIRFWLSEPRQLSLRLREGSTWLLLALLLAVQIALVYWLQR